MHLIPNSILKAVKAIITQSLRDLFNASIKAKIFLENIKIARVTPIFKNGETDNLGILSFSILLATLNYQARATFSLHYSLNGVANAW